LPVYQNPNLKTGKPFDILAHALKLEGDSYLRELLSGEQLVQ
jgi:hypothetical protein